MAVGQTVNVVLKFPHGKFEGAKSVIKVTTEPTLSMRLFPVYVPNDVSQGTYRSKGTSKTLILFSEDHESILNDQSEGLHVLKQTCVSTQYDSEPLSDSDIFNR